MVTVAVTVSFVDSTKATLVLVTGPGAGYTDIDSIGSVGVPGVTITDNSVMFNNVSLPPVLGMGGNLILEGSLQRP